MRTLLLTIRFVGTPYVGWQVQQNGLSVMEKMQDALERVTGTRSDVKGCSRTDSGVHANQYCLSFRTYCMIPTGKFSIALNHNLPKSIAVLSCEEMDEEFHARYDCLGKEYLYKIHLSRTRDPFLAGLVLEYPRPLDIEPIKVACTLLEGTHDFRGFCSIRTDQEITVRTLWWVTAEKQNEFLEIRVAGDGFLFNMVRIIVGTLIRIGAGQMKTEIIQTILKEKNRELAGSTAAAHGLYLNHVFYRPEEVTLFGKNSKF